MFGIPAGWSVEHRDGATLLHAPEASSFIAIAEVGAQADAPSAAMAAWKMISPSAHWPVRLVSKRLGRNGWDESAIIDYQVPPARHMVVVAATYLSKGRWTVLVQSAAEDVAERRGPAFGLVWETLRPAGYVKETFAERRPHRLNAARVRAIQSFISQSMRKLDIPGVGVALIDQGKVVYEGGLGLRSIGQADKVDAHTKFLVASNTKGMTTLLLAKLVDEGRLSWDQPVVNAYPAFQLSDPALASKVLVRQLVCACTGLPRRDFEWTFGRPRETPASVVFDELRTTQATSGFGTTFQYSNTLAAAAGYVAGHVLYPDKEIGAAYDEAMQEEIFKPLRMRETTFSTAAALAGNHASPHGEDVDGATVVADTAFEYLIQPYRPAGGAWSSAHDMALYVQNELASGAMPNNSRLVSVRNLLARRLPGVSIGENSRYGLGLVEDTTWGVPVYHHGGGMPGYQSDIIFIPSAGVGAVLLTNSQSGSLLLAPLMRRLLEILYDGKPEAEDDVSIVAAGRKGQLQQTRAEITLPANAADLAKSYVSPELGSIIVRFDGQRLFFRFSGWESEMASKRNADGTTSYVTIAPSNSGYEFTSVRGGGRQPSRCAMASMSIGLIARFERALQPPISTGTAPAVPVALCL